MEKKNQQKKWPVYKHDQVSNRPWLNLHVFLTFPQGVWRSTADKFSNTSYLNRFYVLLFVGSLHLNVAWLIKKISERFEWERSKLAWQPNLHKKRKVFLHFYASYLYLAEFSWSVERPGLNLGNKRQWRQAIFAGFQKSDITGGNR